MLPPPALLLLLLLLILAAAAATLPPQVSCFAIAPPPFAASVPSNERIGSATRRISLPGGGSTIVTTVGSVGTTSATRARPGGGSFSADRRRSRAPRGSIATTALSLSDGPKTGKSGDDGNKKPKKTKGVYSRPSAAIERGSGFFIPGLEGSRVRLLFGLLALGLTYVNNAVGGPQSGDVSTGGYGVSETVAVLSGVLLLLQAAVEFGAEVGFGVKLEGGGAAAGDAKLGGGGASSSSSTSAKSDLAQRISPDLAGTPADDAVRWAGATYVALTPATHVLLVRDGEALYELGDFSSSSDAADATKKDGGIAAALDEVSSSRGGRVSLPPDHPASVGLLPESARRCVLLQRVEGGPAAAGRRRTCLVVGSDQLLPSFTKNDLRWLGRLAGYVGKAL